MKKIYAIVAGLIVVNLFVYYFIFSYQTNKQDGVYFLNVGQGDSQLIKSNKASFLIDAGRDDKVTNELDKIISFYNKKIDVLFITHPEEDHSLGVIDLLNKYKIHFAILNGDKVKMYDPLVTALKENNVDYEILGSGDKVEYGSTMVDILWPNNKYLAFKHETNDAALVLRVVMDNFSALFTGDISEKIEKIISQGFDIRSDVLKIPHHGSKFSSSKDFLASVSPKISVIEVGKNSYGHPADQVLTRIKESLSKVFRTDLDGTIKVSERDGKLLISKVTN